MKLDTGDFYSTRVLVFMETSPQSNKYNQLFLNAEEFKRMSLTLGTETGEKDTNGNDIVKLNHSEEEYTLPDLKEIN